MKVLVTGSSGFIGTALVPFLQRDGHAVVRAVRRAPRRIDEVPWSPENGIDPKLLEGIDAVVHLAGANIGRRRWTEEAKVIFLRSRVDGTRRIAEAIAAMKNPPEVLVSSSAIGYYGDRGDELMTEHSEPGNGFRSEVCRQWEAATAPAEQAGVRVVMTRTGIVLSPGGGLFPYLLRAARLGMSLRLGSGDQWWSWVTLQDVLQGIFFVITHSSVSGPINLTAPEASPQAGIAQQLRNALGRGAVLPVPTAVLNAALGRERAHEILLASTRAVPIALSTSGFQFTYPGLTEALRELSTRA